MPSLRRSDLTYLLILTAVALGLRVWGIGFGLPNTYHPDEFQYVDAALEFFSGDLNPHRFNNPSLFKYVLFGEYGLVYLAGRLTGAFPPLPAFESVWRADPSPFYILGRLTVAVLGAATVILVYRIGRKAYGRPAALLGATFLAFAFFHARQSHYAVNDVPLTFLTTLVLVLCLRLLHGGTLREYVIAGLVAGLAGATKYTGLLAVVPLLLAHLLADPWPARRRVARLADHRLVGALLATVGGFLAGTPYALLDFSAFTEDLQALSGRGAFGYKGLILDPDGGWLFYLKMLHWGLGSGLFLLSLIGLVYAVYRWSQADVILIAYPLVLYLFMGRQQMFFARFIVPAVPILTLVAARVLVDAIKTIPTTDRRRAVALAAIGLAVLAQPTYSLLRYDYLLTRTDTRTLARRWIEQNVPPDTHIVSEPYGPALDGGRYQVEFTDTEGLPWHDSTLDTYRDAGIDYLIVSRFVYARVFRDPETARMREIFYGRLDAETELVREFTPYAGAEEPPFVFEEVYGPATFLSRLERPGPVIRIYRLTEG